MLYATLTVWLFIIMLCAWAVHALWSRLVQPRVVNSILLPGTLVAQLGRILGLLVTGNAVQNATLMGDDEKGDPKADAPERHKIPVLGPVLTGLLPMAACALCLALASQYWGDDFLRRHAAESAALPQALPTTLDAAWRWLHLALSTAEVTLDAILQSDWTNWPTIAFLYLALCLTVRMGPMDDNRRGAFGAILLTGLVVGLLALAVPSVEGFVLERCWGVLGFAVGMLVLLLFVSLLVTGIVELVRVFAQGE